MRYFFDTEFSETGGENKPTIDLISIGIVSEDGREYYAECSDYDENNCSDWVMENVISKLLVNTQPGFEMKQSMTIAAEIVEFVGNDSDKGHFLPEFWAYYADYDWVVFCWLFGTMMDLPKGFPMHCMDLQQWWVQLGRPEIKPIDPPGAHNALVDAKWNQELWLNLKAYSLGLLARGF